MQDQDRKTGTRRQFIQRVGGSIALLPLAGLAACSGKEPAPAPAAPGPEPAPPPAPTQVEPPVDAPASGVATPEPGTTPAGAERPRLEESDPTAQALGYRHDAAQVDSGRHPQYQAGQLCANCAQYLGSPGDAWGGCNLFPGKLVNANGWCAGYVRRA